MSKEENWEDEDDIIEKLLGDSDSANDWIEFGQEKLNYDNEGFVELNIRNTTIRLSKTEFKNIVKIFEEVKRRLDD